MKASITKHRNLWVLFIPPFAPEHFAGWNPEAGYFDFTTARIKAPFGESFHETRDAAQGALDRFLTEPADSVTSTRLWREPTDDEYPWWLDGVDPYGRHTEAMASFRTLRQAVQHMPSFIEDVGGLSPIVPQQAWSNPVRSHARVAALDLPMGGCLNAADHFLHISRGVFTCENGA